MANIDFAEGIAKAVYLQSITDGKSVEQANKNATAITQTASDYFKASWNHELAPTEQNKRTLELKRIKFMKLCKKFNLNLAAQEA